MSQREDLRKLLNLLPRLAHFDGRPVEDVCASLSLARSELLELIQSASALAWGEHDPGEVLDIWLEDGRLCVHTGGLFEQVVRLVPTELLALRMGAVQVAATGLVGSPARLEALLERIEDSLGSSGDASGRLQAAVSAETDPTLDPALLESVMAALRTQRRLRLQYFSHRAQTLGWRVVDPWTPFQEAGVWYLQAFDVERGGERLFRLDRVVQWELLEQACGSAPPLRGHPTARPEEGHVRIHLELGGALARLAQEQAWPGLGVQENGRVRWQSHCRDQDALLRSLLPWAPDVEVVDPPELRDSWCNLKDEVLVLHGAHERNQE